ncbi:UDP-glucose dehydrogenase family protein [Helicobacter winghamensis]|uniref:UDP-glucose 6-dehydrogenase n=1 Tax=Helicobacter winghamensis TaxID=157268 RepID=A0A2N3PKH5_9HELI|nr:UDP-glucose/GDP-mannose dehydrogenase family protein [Helicobacter winghamensis]EEO25943.1 nucleotide sugar dehydrogenase [Helicobacter winghamensis ATCC BAA-430]PKT76958.1 UDP-glucose 6-dehydrogenase [Helicobacter winghamensis]PKT77098.1 UDP-glucose 6-dehydrogenase [Helicobacter winghamensis]PKT77659.1 UDP-glucose 6-dehydrogenase [Helicobacter winghamensis]PKT81897.1 UDP-glucose 6-dehydrogenase [Helicobacter winghamensis]
MNIVIIGTGYVGLVSGACFADMGNNVICVDIVESKIARLNAGEIPIFEPGLQELVKRNKEQGNLSFTTSLKESLQKVEVAFIAVGTPMGEDGSADLQYVLEVAREIGKTMESKMLIVDKSTVPVGTAQKVKEAIKEELKKRDVSIPFSVASNPEFLKEGDAINDFLRPDRVVIGIEEEWAKEILKEVYAPFLRSYDRLIVMDIKSAEMTKYAANAMLATKISFINEIARICEVVGADVNQVRIGIGSDKRIGYSFIYPGCGYGGSCFPKDVKALEKIAQENGVEARMLQATAQVNEKQKRVLGEKIIEHFGESLKGRRIGIWGLSFKPGTDDMREATSLVLIEELLKREAEVSVYDPRAMEEAKGFYFKGIQNIMYASNKYDALNACDAMVLVTEWKEFRSPDFLEIKERLKEAIIFDGRNQYNAKRLKELGFIYYQIGV